MCKFLIFQNAILNQIGNIDTRKIHSDLLIINIIITRLLSITTNVTIYYVLSVHNMSMCFEH